MTQDRTIGAVLFDMDGVVADTQESVTEFWQDAAAIYGVDLSAGDFSQHIYGVPASHTLDWLFPRLDERERQSVLDRMYEREEAGPYSAIPGALSLLHALVDHHIPTALVTSGELVKVNAVFRDLCLDQLFAATVSRNDIRFGKPDPEGYLLAAGRLGVAAHRCIVLEDAVSGVAAAVAAGSLCIGVAGPEGEGALRLAGASVVVPDLRSISVDGSSGRPMLITPETCFELATRQETPASSVHPAGESQRGEGRQAHVI